MRRRCLRMEGTAEIAARLGVSRQTVWGYRSSRTKRGDAKLREALEAEGVRLPKPKEVKKLSGEEVKGGLNRLTSQPLNRRKGGAR